MAENQSIKEYTKAMKAVYTILFLTGSNIFMTLAWYGHLKFKDLSLFRHTGFWATILISWGFAFFEYCLQVPGNSIGFQGNGGPFNLMELKILQEVISLSVFTVFMLLVFKNEPMQWNHFAAFICIILAVYFVFYNK